VVLLEFSIMSPSRSRLIGGSVLGYSIGANLIMKPVKSVERRKLDSWCPWFSEPRAANLPAP